MTVVASQRSCCGRLFESSKLASAERQTILGAWRQGEKTYRDELLRMFVDVPANPAHDQFFQEFKETLKRRFQQLDLWVTSHDIRVL